MKVKVLRNQAKMNAYKERFGYCCMYPGCQIDYGIETHHIVPLKRGGKDDNINYITLCYNCHHGLQIHSQYLSHELILATWKYYFEANYGEEIIHQSDVIVPEHNIEELEDDLSVLNTISKKILNSNYVYTVERIIFKRLTMSLRKKILKLISSIKRKEVT